MRKDLTDMINLKQSHLYLNAQPNITKTKRHNRKHWRHCVNSIAFTEVKRALLGIIAIYFPAADSVIWVLPPYVLGQDTELRLNPPTCSLVLRYVDVCMMKKQHSAG